MVDAMCNKRSACGSTWSSVLTLEVGSRRRWKLKLVERGIGDEKFGADGLIGDRSLERKIR